MGIPNSAFSRLCAALRTPMASFSSSSCGWLRGWLQQVLVKQSARSLDQSIFDSLQRPGKKPQKNHNTKIPQRQRPVIQHITASFLFFREESQKENIYTFSFIYFAQGFAYAKHYFAGFVFDTHEDRHSYPQYIYLESQSIKTLFISQMLIKVTFGNLYVTGQ